VKGDAAASNSQALTPAPEKDICQGYLATSQGDLARPTLIIRRLVTDVLTYET
jgi:hypothetical protein